MFRYSATTSRRSVVNSTTSQVNTWGCSAHIRNAYPRRNARDWIYSYRRPFSSQQEGHPQPMKDPSHPSLYYHLFESETPGMSPVFALTLTEERPKFARSRTVLGWLPAGAGTNEDSEGSGLNDFVENASFIPLLHEAVRQGLLHDDIWKNVAIQTQSGWMHIFDQRNPPPLGRIPSPDDIIASVRVEDNLILLETYQAMPSYRVCTTDGVCQLSDGLMESLNKILHNASTQEMCHL